MAHLFAPRTALHCTMLVFQNFRFDPLLANRAYASKLEPRVILLLECENGLEFDSMILKFFKSLIFHP